MRQLKPITQSRRLIVDSRGVRSAVIFDIDGVLCDSEEANAAHVRGCHEQGIDPFTAAAWEGFDVSGFEPIAGWVQLARLLWFSGLTIICLTARPEGGYSETATTEWLDLHLCHYDLLVMRPLDASYHTFKRDAVLELKKEFHVHLAIDDSPTHLAAYEEAGVPTIRAHAERNDH